MELEYIKYKNVHPDGSLKKEPGSVEVNGGIYQSEENGGCSIELCNCSPSHWITFMLERNTEGIVEMLKVSFNDKEEIEKFRKDGFFGNPSSIGRSDNYKAMITDEKGKVFYFTEDNYDGWSIGDGTDV